MSIALRQETVAAGAAGASQTVVSNALPSPALLGSVIEVWIAANSGFTISSVVDSAGQTYTLVGSINDSTDSSFLALYALTNNTSATAFTVTCTWTVATVTTRNIQVREITGAKNQPPDTSNFPARIVTPGTGANAISIALTSGSQPALISGVVAAVAGSGALAAGTGFTGTVAFIAGAGFHASLFESKRVTASGSNPCTWTDSTDGGTSTYLGGAVIWDEAGSVTVYGQLPTPGPGISPSARDQFHVPIRDTSGQQGVIAGQSYSVSTDIGNLSAGGAVSGLSTSVSTNYGQLTGTGAMPGLSTSVSTDFGTVSQATTTYGALPGSGPGVSPSSLFQFSSLILDETLFAKALIQGNSASASTDYGALAGAAQFTAQAYDVSMAFGALTTLSNGVIAGFAASESMAFGNLRALTVPVTPGVCTNLWSADGNFNWSADGYPGISADGYEPTPQSCAVAALAGFGVNVGQLTLACSNFGVPVGWVITGYVPFLSAAFAGQYIPLTISDGPCPTATTLVAPNVTGMFYYDAQLAILAAGFLIGPPTWALSATVSPQYVISQSIPPGTPVNNQTQITIVVAGFPATNQPGIIVPTP